LEPTNQKRHKIKIKKREDKGSQKEDAKIKEDAQNLVVFVNFVKNLNIYCWLVLFQSKEKSNS